MIKKVTLLSAALLAFATPAKANNSLSCMALNIYHEARGQSVAGQMAVALVVMNRVKDKRYPNTACDVILQGPHRRHWKDKTRMIPVRHRCQFSWYCDGRSDKIKDIKAYNLAQNISKLVMNVHEEMDFTEGATHYHTINVWPDWAPSKTRTTRIEDHIFYRWEKPRK